MTGSLIGPAPEVGSGVREGRAKRTDGWTADRIRIFLETLAACGVVEDACRAAEMSRQSAYAFRNRAAGGGFRVAWDAACQLARRPLADAAMSRALNGTVEEIRQNGEVVAQRHRFDNRLTMAVLTRLDRLCESDTEENRAARLAAGEFDQFVDLVAEGGKGAAQFIAARRDGDAMDPDRASLLLERLDNYGRYRVGHPDEIDISDLDPAERETWTEDQKERAGRSGLIARLDKEGAARQAELESQRTQQGAGAPTTSLATQHLSYFRWKIPQGGQETAEAICREVEIPEPCTTPKPAVGRRQKGAARLKTSKRPATKKSAKKPVTRKKAPKRRVTPARATAAGPSPPDRQSAPLEPRAKSTVTKAPAPMPEPIPVPLAAPLPPGDRLAKLPTMPKLPKAPAGYRDADGNPFYGRPPAGWVATD